jgi:osmotically-inducible protein OsmY
MLSTTRLPERMLTEVFVGNRCIEDNTEEAAKVAIWKAIGDDSHGVKVTIKGTIASLEGIVRSEAQRAAAEAAALDLFCIEQVNNRLSIEPSATAATTEGNHE